MTESLGTSSMVSCMRRLALAKGLLSAHAAALPEWKAFTHGSQSTKNVHPCSATIAAWVKAQVSVAGMSSAQSGGCPMLQH